MTTGRYVVNHAALSDIGLIRSLNEDALGFIEIHDGYVFIVCDGMGGHEGGEIASKTAVRAIIEFLNSQKIENVSIALHQAIQSANKEIYQEAQMRPDLKGMGTTVVLLLFYKDEIYTAHAGDSRAYVFSGSQFVQITKDHSVVQEMLDNGVLQPEEAVNHPRKNEITKALGIREEVSATIINKPLKAKVGNRFIVCSDGLSGLVSHLEFSEIVRKNPDPNICAAELVSKAREAGGPDNISVQVIDIVESPYQESFYPFIQQKTSASISNAPKKKLSKRKIIQIGAAIVFFIVAASCMYKLLAKDYRSAEELRHLGFITEKELIGRNKFHNDSLHDKNYISRLIADKKIDSIAYSDKDSCWYKLPDVSSQNNGSKNSTTTVGSSKITETESQKEDSTQKQIHN